MSLPNDDAGDARITGINVTPLVDVTLVLLVVFMVTAKTVGVTHTIPLDLPSRSTSRPAAQLVLAVDIDAAGVVTVDGRRLASEADLVRVASEAHSRDENVRAVVHAAETTSHGSVVRVLDGLRTAKVAKIAFAAKPRE